MTIQAQRPHGLSPSPHHAERPTLGLDAKHPSYANAFAMLDHRTRARCMPRELAPPGRYLEVEDGGTVHLLPLDRPLIHIGRGLISDVRLEDLHVSRRHAIVAQRGDGVRVLDDRSSTGTFVNGRKVTVSYLSDGDVLRLGRVVFRFVEIKAQLQTPPLRRITLPVRTRREVPADAAA
ncbi:MAG: FHA domain-containing protein [Solirubrobacteraceae bacterium]